MSDDDKPREPKVEVMPPSTSSNNSLADLLRMDDTPLSVVLYKRMELWGAERVRRGLEAVLRAEQCVYEAGVMRNHAKVEFEKSKVPLEKLDDILAAERERVEAEIEGMKIKAKLDIVNMKSDLAQAEFEAEYQASEREIRKLRMDIQLEEAKNPKPSQTQERKSRADKLFEKAKEKSDALRKLKIFIDGYFEEHGVDSEEELPDEIQHIITQVREGIAIGEDDEY